MKPKLEIHDKVEQLKRKQQHVLKEVTKRKEKWQTLEKHSRK